MIKISTLARADIPGLANLAEASWRAAFSAGLTEDDLAVGLEQRNTAYFLASYGKQTILVARSDSDEMLGFIEFGFVDDELVLDKLYVATERQGEGIGTELIMAFLKHPGVAGQAIWLDVWDQNHGAIRLYESFGWEVVGERPFEVPSGAETTPDLIMCRKPG